MLFEPLENTNAICGFISLGNSGGESFIQTLIANNPPVQGKSLFLSLSKEDKIKDLTSDQISDLKFIGGHIHKPELLELGRPIEYVILLRNPVRKFVSDFNWAQGNYCGAPMRFQDDGFPDYKLNREKVDAEYLKALTSIENYIVYFENLRNKISGNSDIGCRTLFGSFFQYFIHPDVANEPDHSVIDYTLTSLNKECRFIGITEYFEESLYGLCKLFSWPEIKIPWVRVGPYRPQLTINDITQDQCRRIKSILSIEMVIYSAMRKQFEIYFCAKYSLHDYMQYKAKCISNDIQLLENFLDGDSEYIPKPFFEDTKLMRELRSKVYSAMQKLKTDSLDQKNKFYDLNQKISVLESKLKTQTIKNKSLEVSYERLQNLNIEILKQQNMLL